MSESHDKAPTAAEVRRGLDELKARLDKQPTPEAPRIPYEGEEWRKMPAPLKLR